MTLQNETDSAKDRVVGQTSLSKPRIWPLVMGGSRYLKDIDFSLPIR